MKTYLVTGGSGFFGTVLKRRLLSEGHYVINVDLHEDEERHPNQTFVQGDISDRALLERVFSSSKIDGVFHVAAKLAHAVESPRALWKSNVEGTEVVASLTKKFRVPNLVFTSSNCLWGNALGRPVREDDPPNPVEIYGRSKWEGEKIIARYASDFNAVAIRCPTIVDSGRLGLLAILFEFIDEERRVWTVGGGHNRYQFISAQDLAEAAILAINHHRSDVFNIGSDDVKSLREIYSYVIQRANSRSKVTSLPLHATITAMRLAHHLRISPLGPYHYKMIAEDFIFDTQKIKRELGWSPTLTNEQMLWNAYKYYSQNRREIESRTQVSAHKQPAKMGIIKLLKSVS